jgi:hypothetical protein
MVSTGSGEVFELVGRMKHPAYRALILLSVFGTLRWGEKVGVVMGNSRVRRWGVGWQGGVGALGLLIMVRLG